jgi:L-aminoadipate-semialdehyde dehydrogenase
LNPNNIPSEGLPESDHLINSAKGLATGYGQTKWVSEALMRDAGERGLRGVILRPGYVTGHSGKGTTITDDFLVRILKGCIQLGSFPELGDDNFINMMPVDGVAAICAAAALATNSGMKVLNAVSRTMTFNTYLFSLQRLGYDVRYKKYDTWRKQLQQYVAASATGNGEEHALLPLYHLAVSDLPADSRSPLLRTANAKEVVADSHKQKVKARFEVTDEILKRYFAYLVELGFLPKPQDTEMELPPVELSEQRRSALSKIEGRGKI